MIMKQTRINLKRLEENEACDIGLSWFRSLGKGEECSLQEIWDQFDKENSYRANRIVAWLVVALLHPILINSTVQRVYFRLGISGEVYDAFQSVPVFDPGREISSLKKQAREHLKAGRFGSFSRVMLIYEIYRANTNYWKYSKDNGHDYAYYRVMERLVRNLINYAWRLGKTEGNEEFWVSFKKELHEAFVFGLEIGEDFGMKGVYYNGKGNKKDRR